MDVNATFDCAVQCNSTPVTQPASMETADAMGVELGNVYGRNEFIEKRPEIAIPCLIVLGVAGGIGTFGNILTLLMIAKVKNIRSVETIFIVNLAISDMIVTSIADPMSIIGKKLLKSIPFAN